MPFHGRLAFIAVALCAASPAWAATDADIAEIRSQIRELKDSYEARIRALEDKLKAAEERAAQAPAPAPVAAASVSSSSPSTPTAFNPAISAILAGQYANLSRDSSQFRRGFSLAESELQFSANVDHRFSANLIFSIAPDNSVEVEEAYGIATALPGGITPKFGRFLSAQGYLNEQHAHAWDFVDAPLAYQAFFDGQYKTDGVQVKWLAPIEHYVEIGGEVGSSPSSPGKNGASTRVAYARTGGDIGESHSWLAGVSLLDTRESRVAIADFVWKYAPNGNPRETNFKLQGEYLRRTEDGEQSGWYVQGVYQFMPMWRAGLRFDRLDPGNADSFRPKRATAMIDWSPSEFSRLRLQFAQAKTANGITDNEFFLQYILSLGAHGAHKY